jgi:hypothetical protein
MEWEESRRDGEDGGEVEVEAGEPEAEAEEEAEEAGSGEEEWERLGVAVRVGGVGVVTVAGEADRLSSENAECGPTSGEGRGCGDSDLLRATNGGARAEALALALSAANGTRGRNGVAASAN